MFRGTSISKQKIVITAFVILYCNTCSQSHYIIVNSNLFVIFISTCIVCSIAFLFKFVIVAIHICQY